MGQLNSLKKKLDNHHIVNDNRHIEVDMTNKQKATMERRHGWWNKSDGVESPLQRWVGIAKLAGLTMSKLAELASIDQAQLSRTYNGKGGITYEDFVELRGVVIGWHAYYTRTAVIQEPETSKSEEVQ